MAKSICTVLLLFIIGCKSGSNESFSPPNEKDINAIIEAFTVRDSLHLLRKSGDSLSKPLLVDLRKLKVTVPEIKTGAPSPVSHSTVSVQALLNIAVEGRQFFTRNDSLYLLYQNNVINDFRLDSKLLDGMLTINLSELGQNEKPLQRYYDLSIPIFSPDHKRAYVELTNNCKGCGGATCFYLQKQNSNWKIVGWDNRWRN